MKNTAWHQRRHAMQAQWLRFRRICSFLQEGSSSYKSILYTHKNIKTMTESKITTNLFYLEFFIHAPHRRDVVKSINSTSAVLFEM